MIIKKTTRIVVSINILFVIFGFSFSESASIENLITKIQIDSLQAGVDIAPKKYDPNINYLEGIEIKSNRKLLKNTYELNNRYNLFFKVGFNNIEIAQNLDRRIKGDSGLIYKIGIKRLFTSNYYYLILLCQF